jgi:hypothetical protein
MVRRICSTASCRGSGSCRDRSVISSFIAGLIEMIRARSIAAILIAACLAGATTEAGAAEPHGRAYLFRGMIDLKSSHVFHSGFFAVGSISSSSLGRTDATKDPAANPPDVNHVFPDALGRVTAPAIARDGHSANVVHSTDGLKIVVRLRPGSEPIPMAVFRQSLRLRPGSERSPTAVFRPPLRLRPG